MSVLSEVVLAADIYRGVLIPENRSPPIPVSVQLDSSRRDLSGHISMSAPLTGEGRIVAGEKKGYECSFKSDIGVGRVFSFAGFCLSSALEGKYTLRMIDGTLANGDLRLNRVEPDKRQSKTDADQALDPPVRTVTSCISVNAACLAACPRGDYNAEFICSNRCRQKFASCKARASTAIPALP